MSCGQASLNSIRNCLLLLLLCTAVLLVLLSGLVSVKNDASALGRAAVSRVLRLLKPCLPRFLREKYLAILTLRAAADGCGFFAFFFRLHNVADVVASQPRRAFLDQNPSCCLFCFTAWRVYLLKRDYETRWWLLVNPPRASV